MFVVNFSTEAWEGYQLGVPAKGVYTEVFNTDDPRWGGSGVINTGEIKPVWKSVHGKECSVTLRIPPLGALMLQGKGCLAKEKKKDGGKRK